MANERRLHRVRLDLADPSGATIEIHAQGYEHEPGAGDIERLEKAAVEFFESAFGSVESTSVETDVASYWAWTDLPTPQKPKDNIRVQYFRNEFWVEIGAPNTMATAEQWSRRQCRYSSDHTPCRILVNGAEVARWTWNEAEARAVKSRPEAA
jgi:hypothetical protein